MLDVYTTLAARRPRWLAVGSLVLLATATMVPWSCAETAAALSPTPESAGPGRQAIAFSLQDQHGTLHAYRLPSDKVSVLFFADHAGSGQLEAWIQPLYERYQDSIAIYGVADVSAVPTWLQGVVTLFIRGQVDYPVMLDWTGTIARAYTYPKGQAHVLLVNPQGDIVFTVTGAVNEQKLAGVLAHIDALLSTAPH